MHRKTATALAITGIAALTLTGCVGEGGAITSTDTVTDEQIAEAMATPTELTFWTWVPDIEDEVALFEEQYPAIDVTVENLGQGTTQHQLLRTALEAGEGAPDLAQIEYQLLPSFVLTDSLLDLAPYGAAELEEDYVDWVWNQVSPGDEVWAIPQDIGPMGNLYRQDILEAAGIDEAPATWDDYAAAAEAVKAATGSYISNLGAAQANQMIAFLWQRGVKPFAYDGAETVSINVNSAEAKEVADYWTDLIQRDLVSTDADFNDQWYQGLANGTYAGWLTAAWGPLFLQGTAGDTSGLWRAAPLPQWSEGDQVSGSWGGSSNVVLATTENPIAAAELAKFINHDPESTLMLATQQFLFPASVGVLESPDFAGAELEFYGGQRVNELFAEVAGTVDTDFQWLPFMEYVQASYEENVTPVLTAKGDLADALDAWQNDLVAYAEAQGFTVE